MTGSDHPRCGHTYTAQSGRRATCTIAPHPRRPDAHYFEWDTNQPSLPDRRNVHPLIITPGDRRG